MIRKFDQNKQITIESDLAKFAANYFVDLAKESIEKNGIFTVALSGGSTPKDMYQNLKEYRQNLDWSKVLIFFSDERSVSLTNMDSNYHMAMHNGIETLGILKEHIFPMDAETDTENNAVKYQNLIEKHVKDCAFDLILLGMGDDGHTASLFPGTKALKETVRLVVKNEVPQKETVRMTFTYALLKKAKQILFLAKGANKATLLVDVLKNKDIAHPSSLVVNDSNNVLWALDNEAAKLIQ